MIRHYREYSVEDRNGKYVAKPIDGDDLEIVSMNERRLCLVIDGLHDALEQYPAVAADQIMGPRLLREWLANPTSVIDVDDAYRRGAC